MTVVSTIANGPAGSGYVLKHGSLAVPFKVQFGERRQLTIHVHPDMRLEVLAPNGREVDSVLKRVDARSGWIAKQWRYFERYQPTIPPRKYVSGETHLYVGRQYRLKVTEAAKSSVKLKGRFLQVCHEGEMEQAKIERLVVAWYREHALHLFRNRMVTCIENCKSLKLGTTPKVSVRQMKRRWGSCTKGGNISLNPDLIRTPIHCIDYVIVHELCHLRIHNHSTEFYRLLTRLMPDWETRKERLDGQAWS
ncbi:M48 family metallopeptidase [bacterium]|nr:M48 family metallopeptidase [bacterium]